MSNDTSSKYEFSFPISGQQKNCYFDVRSLMCTGVPKSYDDKLVVKERIKHLELIFDYISDRSNSAKRNMYNYFKQYVLWAESKSINPFSSDAIKLFGETEFTVKHRRCINRFGALNILNEQIEKPTQGDLANVRIRLNDSAPIDCKPSARKEGFIFSADGEHRIYVNSKAKGITRVDLSDIIEHLKDKFSFLSSLKEIFDNSAGDTFLDRVYKIKDYIPYTRKNGTFFSTSSLANFIDQLHLDLLHKKPSAFYGRRKANAVIELFELAEIEVTTSIRKNAGRLPTPHSKPVTPYEQKDYRELIRLLFKTHRQAYKNLFGSNFSGYITGNKSSLPFSGFHEVLSIFMESSYYLISRYSAWTDGTIKGLMVADVEFESSNGEWVHLKSQKPRSNYKDVKTTLSGQSSIRKTGYQLILDILNVSKHFNINSERLLFRLTNNDEVKPLKLNKKLKIFILNEIPALESLNSQKIRETEINISHERGFKSAVLRSGSTSSVVKRHYSNGSSKENNRQLSNVTNAIMDVAKSNTNDISPDELKSQLRESYRIPVLTDNKSNTPMGTRCQIPQTQSEFSKKSLKRNLGTLSCADLTLCFGCRHAAIIDSVDDIWNLISFKESLTNGRMFSVDKSHHDKNFKLIIAKIDIAIERCQQNHVKSAQEKYDNEGPHPFWSGDEFL